MHCFLSTLTSRNTSCRKIRRRRTTHASIVRTQPRQENKSVYGPAAHRLLPLPLHKCQNENTPEKAKSDPVKIWKARSGLNLQSDLILIGERLTRSIYAIALIFIHVPFFPL